MLWKYIKRKKARLEAVLHMRLGVQMLKEKPLYNVWFLVLFLLFGVVWSYRRVFIPEMVLPQFVLLLYTRTVSALLILMLFLCCIAIIKCIGDYEAYDEEKAVIVKFDEKDIKNGYAILYSKEKEKGSNVNIRKYYTNIYMDSWQEKQKRLAGFLGEHIVAPGIVYEMNNAYIRVMYSAEGAEVTDRGVLYDEL